MLLTAVGVGNAYSWTSTLLKLQITLGDSTSGSLLYAHDTQILLEFDTYKPFVKVPLRKRVSIQANTYYTLCVQYSLAVYYSSVDSDWAVEGGLYFTFAPAVLSGNRERQLKGWAASRLLFSAFSLIS